MITTIEIHPDGTIHQISEGALRYGEPARRVKLSGRIVPIGWRRIPFELLRLAFGDNGLGAAWTRTWGGRWRARLNIFPFGKHEGTMAECVAWQHLKLSIYL